MTRYVLAGDVGGTKTDLALFACESPRRLTLRREHTFSSRDYPTLEAVLGEFVAAGGDPVAAAAFGVAGPVLGDEVTTTNLPWHIRAADVARVVGCERVRLLNDLEATAYGTAFQRPEAFHSLNAGRAQAGNRAVIAAGTGLGQAFLFWDGTRYRTAPSEGGHADFAPQNDREWALTRFLQRRHPEHVSVERAVSGPGLFAIFTFLVEELGRPVEPAVRARLAGGDPGAVVGEAALHGESAVCAEAVDLFLGLYGAQAGNLALTAVAVGGLFVGGGMVVKLLPLVAGPFMRAFNAKGRYAGFMADIPVRVLLDPATGRLGAAHAAVDLLPG
ncbi:MAG: glucokinase [Deltaproteobacteria bacterium]|nr:MAG: glucokinase [Deltaproteobacteria bacterium]